MAETEGDCFGLLIVATMTASISFGSTPERAIASGAASAARSIARRLGDGARAGDDAGALADPLVARVDRADEVVVGDGDLAPGRAVRVDAGVGRAGGLDERDGHAGSPVRAAAASRSSGVFTATAGTPRRARLARPVSVPAGESSMSPTTPSVGERGHAEVPAHGRGDLVDEQVDERGAGRDAPRRRGCSRRRRAGSDAVDLGRRGAQRLDGGGHVARVEGAGDLQRDDARAGGRLGGEGLQCVERAGGDELPAAVVVRGSQVELARGGRRRMPRPRR